MALDEGSASRKDNIFECSLCPFSCKFDYYGRKPPFTKGIALLEDGYVLKDPFTQGRNFIILGGSCSLCNAKVCMQQECSLFYTKRFCTSCVQKNKDDFPEEIKMTLKS